MDAIPLVQRGRRMACMLVESVHSFWLSDGNLEAFDWILCE